MTSSHKLPAFISDDFHESIAYNEHVVNTLSTIYHDGVTKYEYTRH